MRGKLLGFLKKKRELVVSNMKMYLKSKFSKSLAQNNSFEKQQFSLGIRTYIQRLCHSNFEAI